MTPTGLRLPLPNPRTTRPSAPHYQLGGIECIDALRSALGYEGFMGFCRGNVIKYMWRLGHKGTTLDALVSDVEKARTYCDFILEVLRKERSDGRA